MFNSRDKILEIVRIMNYRQKVLSHKIINQIIQRYMLMFILNHNEHKNPSQNRFLRFYKQFA